MTFIPKPNTGTMWQNDKKATDSHPDWRGDIHLDQDFLKQMMEKSDGLVKLQVSAWDNKNRLSLSVSAPFVKVEKTPPKKSVEDEDVPF